MNVIRTDPSVCSCVCSWFDDVELKLIKLYELKLRPRFKVVTKRIFSSSSEFNRVLEKNKFGSVRQVLIGC